MFSPKRKFYSNIINGIQHLHRLLPVNIEYVGNRTAITYKKIKDKKIDLNKFGYIHLVKPYDGRLLVSLSTKHTLSELVAQYKTYFEGCNKLNRVELIPIQKCQVNNVISYCFENFIKKCIDQQSYIHHNILEDSTVTHLYSHTNDIISSMMFIGGGSNGNNHNNNNQNNFNRSKFIDEIYNDIDKYFCEHCSCECSHVTNGCIDLYLATGIQQRVLKTREAKAKVIPPEESYNL